MLNRILAALTLLLMFPVRTFAQDGYVMLERLNLDDYAGDSWTTYEERFYRNPQALSGIGDPVIRREGDSYYCYATGGDKGFYRWRTDFLSSWAYAERMRVFSGTPWATANFWAPEVHKYRDRYVLMYSAQMGADYDLRLGIAFSDSPDGPFRDPLGRPIRDDGYCAIDAHLFVDDDGTPYLFYVRDNYDNPIDGHLVSQTYGIQLTEDLLSFVGSPVLLTTPENEWELKSGQYIWNEGVYVLKNADRYYLYFSANFTSTHDYCVGVAVADSPLGPYVKPEVNPLLAPATSLETGKVIVSGPGHNAFFTVGEELFTSYHVNTDNENPTMDRTLCFDRAGFHTDGTAYINGVSLAPQLLPLADIGLVNAALSAQITSDGDTALLRDGDYCIAEASTAYLWHGTKVEFNWTEAVQSDMLMIYPKRGATGTGRIIMNDRYCVDIDLSAIGTDPGAAVVLCYPAMALTSCQIEWNQETALGEVLVVAKFSE